MKGLASLAFALLLAGCAAPAADRGAAASPAAPALAEARAGIEEANRRNRAAMLAKDMDAVMALRTEDFHSLTPDGLRHDRAAMQTYIRNFLDGVTRWIDLSFEIERLTLDGREADAITRQHAVRMHLRPDGRAHHVETWVTQRERWRLTADGWKLCRVDELRDQRRLVDGQPA